jgi:hypothetical protein
MADAATYAQIMNEINLDSNPNGGPNQSYTADQIQKFKDGSDPLNYPNTDWEKQTLKGTALQNQHSLSVNGGSEDVKYFVSLGTLYQDGIYKSGVTKYHQYNFPLKHRCKCYKTFKSWVIIIWPSGRQAVPCNRRW